MIRKPKGGTSASVTVGQCCELYRTIHSHADGEPDYSLKVYGGRIKDLFKGLGDTPVDEVTAKHILDLWPLVTDKYGQNNAPRVECGLKAAKAVFTEAVKAGVLHRDDHPLAGITMHKASGPGWSQSDSDFDEMVTTINTLSENLLERRKALRAARTAT